MVELFILFVKESKSLCSFWRYLEKLCESAHSSLHSTIQEIMVHIKKPYKCLIYNYIDFNKSNEHENVFTNLRYMVAYEMPRFDDNLFIIIAKLGNRINNVATQFRWFSSDDFCFAFCNRDTIDVFSGGYICANNNLNKNKFFRNIFINISTLYRWWKYSPMIIWTQLNLLLSWLSIFVSEDDCVLHNVHWNSIFSTKHLERHSPMFYTLCIKFLTCR